MQDAHADVLLDGPPPRARPDGQRALPTRQPRAERTREKLLQTGKHLLSAGGFDDVSIAQIAAQSGCSVGAFYIRFKNKQAYFEFLLDRIIDEVRQQALRVLNPASLRGLTLQQTLERCVRHHIGVIRANEGPLCAALEYSINGGSDWQPIRDAGAWLSAHYTGLILAKSRRRDKQAAAARLQIGLHIATGHLLNVITHKPAVLALDHPHLEFWLSSIVLHCLNTAGPMPDALRAAGEGREACQPRN
ncbi:TetR/AcrR family transcriptional regulator [Verticiella sediminum]|nr:TetR/AcrR family transcriptional regulator [Verticiella sediminum]